MKKNEVEVLVWKLRCFMNESSEVARSISQNNDFHHMEIILQQLKKTLEISKFYMNGLA